MFTLASEATVQDEIRQRIQALLASLDHAIANRHLGDAIAASEAIACLCGALASVAWSQTDSSERGW